MSSRIPKVKSTELAKFLRGHILEAMNMNTPSIDVRDFIEKVEVIIDEIGK